MSKIPKREGAGLNGYGLSVLAIIALLFALPFVSGFVIQVGETVGNIEEVELFDGYSAISAPYQYEGINGSASWISSGNSPDAGCDEASYEGVPGKPWLGTSNEFSGQACDGYGGLGGYAWSKPDEGYMALMPPCGSPLNSSDACGDEDFSVRLWDFEVDYQTTVLKEFDFSYVRGSSLGNHQCSHPSFDSFRANISLDYTVIAEVWEERRTLPSNPAYVQKAYEIELFSGNHEFYNLADGENGTKCFNYMEINHKLDFIESNRYASEIQDRLDDNTTDIFGNPINSTVAFRIEWTDVYDEDRSVRQSRSTALMPYEGILGFNTIGLNLVNYDAEYFNATSNTLTIILGLIFALTAFASTPYWNPTKSRIIDRLRDA